MKAILILLLISQWLIPSLPAQKPMSDSFAVTILIKNKKITVDSVYIIFDRYDLTGAGIIKKVFYPSGNQIVIEKVPTGKYYVDVYCIGVDHQSFTKVSTIGRRRSNKVSIPLKTYEAYVPGSAVIPPSTIDLSNLVVTQKRLFK
jgi:hypothetical protein